MDPTDWDRVWMPPPLLQQQQQQPQPWIFSSSQQHGAWTSGEENERLQQHSVTTAIIPPPHSREVTPPTPFREEAHTKIVPAAQMVMSPPTTNSSRTVLKPRELEGMQENAGCTPRMKRSRRQGGATKNNGSNDKASDHTVEFRHNSSANPSEQYRPHQKPSNGPERTADGSEGDCQSQANDDGDNDTGSTASWSSSTSDASPSISTDSHIPSVRLRDVIGHNDAKLRIQEILLPMQLPAHMAQAVFTGIRSMPSSVLLHGPPGCGKTQLAQAMAGQARAAFLSVAPSDVLSKFVGDSERAVHDLFVSARDQASRVPSQCALVFLDEIDALGQTREQSEGGGRPSGGGRGILAELLMQLNGIGKAQSRKPSNSKDGPQSGNGRTNKEQRNPTVLVVGATNRTQDVDPALLRRFGVRLFVGRPVVDDIVQMIERHLRGIHHALTADNIREVATLLHSQEWSGSDVHDVVREACLAPVRECLQQAAAAAAKTSSSSSTVGKTLKNRTSQQSGNTLFETTSENNDNTSDDESDDGREQDDLRRHLMEHFQDLRPVMLQDLDRAIRFCIYHRGGNAEVSSSGAEISNTETKPSISKDYT